MIQKELLAFIHKTNFNNTFGININQTNIINGLKLLTQNHQLIVVLIILLNKQIQINLILVIMFYIEIII